MLILEIALGIILAVVLLAIWPWLLLIAVAAALIIYIAAQPGEALGWVVSLSVTFGLLYAAIKGTEKAERAKRERERMEQGSKPPS